MRTRPRAAGGSAGSRIRRPDGLDFRLGTPRCPYHPRTRATDAGARLEDAVNVVTMTGRLTADPVQRQTKRGVVTTFRLGSDDDPRMWVDVESWGPVGGQCATHLRCG